MYARLCLETPRAGGRLMETGTEDFLKLRRDGRLGNSTLISISPCRPTYPLVKVPVIVVFTKYDGLINQFDYDLGPSGGGLNDHAIKQLVEGRAGTKLRETCVRPVQLFAGSDIPITTVSSGYYYSDYLVCA
jgi:hypothetical protein